MMCRLWRLWRMVFFSGMQAAGHGLGEHDKPSLLVSEDGSLLKMVPDEVRGSRELQFYACLELCMGSTESWCLEMRSTLEKHAALALYDARSVIRCTDGLDQALEKLYGATWCIPRCCMLHL